MYVALSVEVPGRSQKTQIVLLQKHISYTWTLDCESQKNKIELVTRFGTDQIWNMYRDPEIVKTYLHKYMVDDWESISSMGEYIRGYDKLENLTLTTMNAFPDIKLHIVDTFCEGLGTYAI